MTTVKLSKPVEHNGKIYDEFTFREAEVPLPAFRKVKSRDLNAIMAATKDLLGEEPPVTTGA